MARERYAQVRSKNYSCNGLRKSGDGIGPFPIRSIVRLGSTTETEVAFPKSYGKYPIIEVNTVKAIQNSRSKLLMKACFKESNVRQSDWFTFNRNTLFTKFGEQPKLPTDISGDLLPFPILAKRVFGFKGQGMVKIDIAGQLETFIRDKTDSTLNSYYFEQFFNGSREYRLHVAEDGCFMAWRKLRKRETPEDRRWYFNSDYCNWVGENHELFNKPSNWNEMVNESIKALKAVGLDIGCIDLRCQGSNKKKPEFIIVEVNSAPALAEQGIIAYREKLYNIINNKIKKL